ncbi:PREDICTED: uncharacterized protein LOC106747303 [Dinoponera quadriceps]|uniref:Uncharacterized protein LOC106747303 n=1 Tax=Dinoponera quadriceps TaxID=609295 RepID=A0A6P3XQI3_DINQU|nr:PREDICTED: uncharacterized protein LOC106747303 [Dinoponera quadriceps]
MDLLPLNFYVLRFCGVWEERKESNLILRLVSFCYRYTVVILIYHFTVSEIIELVRIRNNIEELTECLFLALTYLSLCLKYLNFLVRQFEVRALLDCFRAKSSMRLAESLISCFSNSIFAMMYTVNEAKRIIWFYMILCQVTALFLLVMPLLATDERRLPFKVYMPYSIAALLPYVLTYLQQVAALIYGVFLNTSFDCLVYGLIIHTCGQIELMCHRMTETFACLREDKIEPRKIDAIENLAIAECVNHHISVHNIIFKIQSLFVWTITVLFLFSLVTLCTSIYQMSKKEMFSPEFFTFIMYLGSMSFQAFSYCWYGNELDLKNKSVANAIYVSNWTAVSAKQRKSLVLVMMMSQRGRILSFYGIFGMILNTFTWILKTSYSAFNLLQQASSYIDELTEVLFVTLTYLSLCLKYLNFLVRQFEMRALLDCFRAKVCQPRNSAEESILKQYNRKAKQTTWFFLIICQVTGLFLLAMPLWAIEERRLPLKAYVPYSIAALGPYVLTYLQQVAVLIYGIMLNSTFDSLVYGLIIQTCGQIELMCHRMTETFMCLRENKIERREIDVIENLAIAECVSHHISVYNIIYKIQSLFMWTIAVLFLFSLVTLCTSIYQMSKKEMFSPEFFTFIVYLGSMLFEILLYCWYGNELDLKMKSVAYAIYVSNWMAVSAKQRKSLMLVMLISQRGRILSFYGFSDLILNTFMSLQELSLFSMYAFMGQLYSSHRISICLLVSMTNRYAIVILIYEFTISEVIELVRTRDHIEDITEGLFLTLTYVALCFKYGNFLARRDEVSILLNCFRSKTCQPKNFEERTILIKYDPKWCVRTFMSMSQATCWALVFAPIVGPQDSDRPLPFKTYMPYSIFGWYLYLATYLQHVAAIFYGVLLNVSFDSLVYGFTLHACGQIELLCHRLSEIFKDCLDADQYRIKSNRAAVIGECVRHHLRVHELVRRIQSLFVWTVTVLFIFSMVTLCTSIFQMSKKKLLSVGFLSLVLYLGCMLYQVFFYCWYGNELRLKSKRIANAIYFSNWTMATPQERRSLVLIMINSQKGFVLSYHGIFSLCLDTFTWIFNTSYSAFNLLQQASN